MAKIKLSLFLSSPNWIPNLFRVLTFIYQYSLALSPSLSDAQAPVLFSILFCASVSLWILLGIKNVSLSIFMLSSGGLHPPLCMHYYYYYYFFVVMAACLVTWKNNTLRHDMGMTTYFCLKKQYAFLTLTSTVMRIVWDENKSYFLSSIFHKMHITWNSSCLKVHLEN